MGVLPARGAAQSIGAVERQIGRALVSSIPAAGIPAAVRLVGLDPLSETAQRHLISAYMRCGDRAAAERQYESCARVLAVELGVTPDPQTKALLIPHTTSDPAPARRTLYAQHGGLHLAYQVVGNGPIDILLVPGFASHVERIWEEPRSRAVLDCAFKDGASYPVRQAWCGAIRSRGRAAHCGGDGGRSDDRDGRGRQPSSAVDRNFGRRAKLHSLCGRASSATGGTCTLRLASQGSAIA